MEGTDRQLISFQDQNKRDLMTQVSIQVKKFFNLFFSIISFLLNYQQPRVFNPSGKISIACIDCGLKNNQSRLLCQLDAKVTVFPWNHPVKQNKMVFYLRNK
jgi:carbamoylphosphate synthase small subunit